MFPETPWKRRELLGYGPNNNREVANQCGISGCAPVFAFEFFGFMWQTIRGSILTRSRETRATLPLIPVAVSQEVNTTGFLLARMGVQA